MAALLARWLNTQVKLSVKVHNLDADFSSGYLFGELLVKLGYLEDSSDFSRRKSTSVRASNLRKLAAALKEALGIELGGKAMTDIMTEQRGSAARLLFKIKTEHDRKVGAPGALPPPKTGHADAGVLSESSGHKWVRPQATEADVRAVVAANPAMTYNQKMMALHTHKFVQERLSQDARAQAQEANELAEIQAAQRRKYEAQRAEFKEKQQFMATWIDERKQNWKATQRVKQDRERTELRFELTMAERARMLRTNARHRATADMLTGIDSFEKNMKRLGSGPKSPRELTAADFGDGSYETPYEMTQRLAGKYVEDHKPAEVVGYFQDVKAKIGEDRVARRERQTRRRKMMVAQQRSQAAVEAARLEQERVNVLLEAGRSERLAASQLWRQRYEEKRRMRQIVAMVHEGDERREEQFQRTLARDRKYYRDRRRKREEETKVQRAERAARLAAAASKRAERHRALCASVAEMIVDTVEAVVDYKTEMQAAVVPRRVWEGIKGAFVSGEIAAARLAAANAAAEDAARARKGDPVVRLFDSADKGMLERGEGGWAIGARQTLGMVAQSIGANAWLDVVETPEAALLAASGGVSPSEGSDVAQTEGSGATDGASAAVAAAPPVAQVLQSSVAAWLEGEMPEMGSPPPTPLRLSVLGGPLTGKSELAERVAKQYYLRRITAREVVEECVRVFQDAEARAAREEAGEEVEPQPERNEEEERAYETTLGLGATASLVLSGADPMDAPARVAALTGGKKGKKKGKKGKAKKKKKGDDDDVAAAPFRPDKVLIDSVIESEAFTRALALFVRRVDAETKTAAAAVAAGTAEPSPGCGGWVLDGLPRTHHQALALEFVLDGPVRTHMPDEWGTDVSALLGALGDASWAPPPPLPAAEEDTDGKTAEDAKTAEGGEEAAGVELASALDAVVVLRTGDDAVAQRAAGQLLQADGTAFDGSKGAGSDAASGDGSDETKGDGSGEAKGQDADGADDSKTEGGDENDTVAPFSGLPYPLQQRSESWGSLGQQAVTWFQRTRVASPLDASSLSPAQVFGAVDVQLEAQAASKLAQVAVAEADAARQAAVAAALSRRIAAAREEAGLEDGADLEEEAATAARAAAEAEVAEAEAKAAAEQEAAAAAAAAAPVDWRARLRDATSLDADALVAGLRRRMKRGEAVDTAAGEVLLQRWREVDKAWEKRVQAIMGAARTEGRYLSERLQQVQRAFLCFLRRPLVREGVVTNTLSLGSTAAGTRSRRHKAEVPVEGIQRVERMVKTVAGWSRREWTNDEALAAMEDEIDEAEAELWGTAERRGERAVSLLQGLRHDGWLEQRNRVVVALAQCCLSACVDRFDASAAMVCEASQTLGLQEDGDGAVWGDAAERVLAVGVPDGISRELGDLPRTFGDAVAGATAAIAEVFAGARAEARGGATVCALAQEAVQAYLLTLRVASTAVLTVTAQSMETESTWAVMDAFISQRLKAVNSNINALTAQARRLLSDGVAAAPYVVLSEGDDIAQPWGGEGHEGAESVPEPLPGADLGRDASQGTRRCASIADIDGYMAVVDAVARDAAARLTSITSSLPVFVGGPRLTVPPHRLPALTSHLIGLGATRTTSAAVVAKEMRQLAGAGVVPAAWSGVSASRVHGAVRAVSRAPSVAGGDAAVDVRLVLLSLVYAALPSLPTVSDLARMTLAFKLACRGVGTSGVHLSMPPAAFASTRLWFESSGSGSVPPSSPPQSPSGAAGAAAGAFSSTDAAPVKAALLSAWSTGDSGRLDCTALLLDLCADPRSGADAPSAFSRHDTHRAAGSLQPWAFAGLYKAFMVMSMLEGRLASAPGSGDGTVPVWHDLVVSSDGFRALLKHETARGWQADVDAIVRQHASEDAGTVSFAALAASRPMWLCAAGTPVPYSLPSLFNAL